MRERERGIEKGKEGRKDDGEVCLERLRRECLVLKRKKEEEGEGVSSKV